MSEDTITISKREYFELRLERETLQMAEAAGVDNWQFWGECFRPDWGKSLAEREDELRLEIFGRLEDD